MILQNSNPPDGVYSLGTFTYYIGQDIYPGKGKIQMHLNVNGDIYYSESSDSLNVHISHLGDSIEVFFKEIFLRKHPGQAKVSGKVKIAPRPIKPIYKGNAQFTDGNADTLLYSVDEGIHIYRFRKQRNNMTLSNWLELRSTEPLQETKIYKVTDDTPKEGEVNITLSPANGGIYWPSPLSNTDGKLYISKEANGNVNFSFKDIPSPGLEKDFYGSGVIYTFMP